MTTTTTTRNDIAQRILGAFYEQVRADGKKFWSVHEDWWPLMHRIHGSMGPDDLKYQMVQEVLSRMVEYDADQWEEVRSEIADGLVDIWNIDRCRWLASSLDRAVYVDDAVAEFGIWPDADFSIFKVLGWGQYAEYDEIFGILMQAIDELVSEAGDDE